MKAACWFLILHLLCIFSLEAKLVIPRSPCCYYQVIHSFRCIKLINQYLAAVSPPIPPSFNIVEYMQLSEVKSYSSLRAGFANKPNLAYFKPKFRRWLHWGYGGSHFDFTNFQFQNSFFLVFFKTNTMYINCKHCKPGLNLLNWRIIHVCTHRGYITIKITQTLIIIMDFSLSRSADSHMWP